AGAFLWLSYVGGSSLTATDFLYGGLSFALPLMGILGLHELAHFLVARRHHVEASLPYFIPLPPPFVLFGTFGAFISLREPFPDRKALLDIGASGPLAGFLLSIPVTLLGMWLSLHAPVLSVANCGPTILGSNYGNLEIGSSIFWAALGQFVPVSLVNLHPVALAGWVGLLVTAINLLPAGQLDGGHVFRALFGDRSRFASYGAVVGLLALGVVTSYFGWILFAGLIFLLGVRHPPPLNDLSGLGVKRYLVGAAAVAILITGFVAVPIALPTNSFTVADRSVAPTSIPAGAMMADILSLTVINNDQVNHGYILSAKVVAVNLTTNGSLVPLTGVALADFAKNSSWNVSLPNGNQSWENFSASFTTPTLDFSKLSPGQSQKATITFSNLERASVTVVVTVSQLCSSGTGGPMSYDFALT
ncbi:MAG: site-2 protease family protein, partial [Thermoplasmata archaeon]|nr:site-2 protease family protein [Thermoplasmata archaeon]